MLFLLKSTPLFLSEIKIPRLRAIAWSVAMCLLLTLGLAPSVHAAQIHWIKPGQDGLWSDPANWMFAADKITITNPAVEGSPWSVVQTTSGVTLTPAGAAGGGEILYNGIELPDQWPPKYDRDMRQPMPVPYLTNPPAIITIDVGRQLFVDDFLIESTTLKRQFHQPEYHPANPVLKPDRPWENKSWGWFAAPFSGGAWYDPADRLFKIWYTGGFLASTCYAVSKDGIHWEKPELDVEGKETNIVLEPVKTGTRRVDTTTVWLDHNATNAGERFKYFATESVEAHGWGLTYRASSDGIHWSEPLATKRIYGDRSTVFYNPFRKVWVLSQRGGGPPGRARTYREAAAPQRLVEGATYNSGYNAEGDSVRWVAGEDLDPRHTDPKYENIKPELYNLDVAPYESLLIGQFSIWQGPSNQDCGKLKLQKRNDILLGFSRDGFHWDRACRKRFISCTWQPDNWRFGNVQSVGGGCLVVGDKLYFYFSGRAKPSGDKWDADASTGLAILRRDGFASMAADGKGGTLTTRPLTFKGKHLFVNVDCPKGQLKAEVLDKDGKAIEPFTLANCKPVSCDKTLAAVTWQQAVDLSAVSGTPVRFRFHLTNGSLYAFWVSPDTSGASYGYVAAGGPGFTGPTDTVGTDTAGLGHWGFLGAQDIVAAPPLSFKLNGMLPFGPLFCSRDCCRIELAVDHASACSRQPAFPPQLQKEIIP